MNRIVCMGGERGLRGQNHLLDKASDLRSTHGANNRRRELIPQSYLLIARCVPWYRCLSAVHCKHTRAHTITRTTISSDKWTTLCLASR